MRQRTNLRSVLFSIVLFSVCIPAARTAVAQDRPPPPKREFRGVFVGVAFNRDWPSRSRLHPCVQIDEIREVVSRVKELNCNVIILQVRAFGDRIHRYTAIDPPEPWSTALRDGADPDTTEAVPEKRTYDPLGEWIKACHEAGIELHAWINPFRTDRLIEIRGEKTITLPVNAAPDGYHLTLDPTRDEVQAYIIDQVIRELLEYTPRTDAKVETMALPGPQGYKGINGILVDHHYDRFRCQATADNDEEYPKVSAPVESLLAEAARRDARAKVHEAQTIADALDRFIKRSFEVIHEEHHAKFGMSPGPEDATTRRRLREGWFNYVAPELYFTLEEKRFDPVVAGWLDQIHPQEKGFTPLVAAGLFTMRIQTPPGNVRRPWPKREIADQIQVTNRIRGTNGDVRIGGHVHYTWGALRSPVHGGPSDASDSKFFLGSPVPYREAALAPRCTRPARSAVPRAPVVTWKATEEGRRVVWQSDEKDLLCWTVWLHDPNGWGPMRILGIPTTELPVPAGIDKAAVIAVDRYNRESDFGMASRD